MKKPKTITIGSHIKKIRKSYGYTQEKLAEAVEVSSRYISDVEQDRAKPSYEVLVKICNLFNIGLDEIFSEYLHIKKESNIPFSLLGFEKLRPEDQETIEHLITYFNKTRED